MSLSKPSKLPDSCVQVMFELMHLRELFRIGCISSHWNKIQKMSLKNRNRLVLFVGNVINPWEFLIKNNLVDPLLQDTVNNRYIGIDNCALVCGTLSSDKVQLLKANLPGITTLELCLQNVPTEQIDNVIGLLRHWSPTLTTLKLWYTFQSNEYNEISSYVDNLALFTAISYLASLKHLTLYTDCKILCGLSSFPIRCDLLEEICFLNRNEPAETFITLINYAKINSKLRLSIASPMTNIENLDAFFRLDSSLKPRLRQLNLLSFPINESSLKRLCTCFPDLVELELRVWDLTVHKWASQLAKLSRLTHLKLNVEVKTRRRSVVMDQLKTVKYARLNIVGFRGEEDLLKPLPVSFIFPNVELIHIVAERFPVLLEVKRYLSPLKQCSFLTRIRFTTSHDDRTFSINDL